MVELFMSVEESFGIRIQDDEAERTISVGDLHALVLRKVGAEQRAGCRTSQAFRFLRRELAPAGTPAARARPATPLDSIVPPGAERETCAKVRDALGWKLPDLELPWALVASLAAASAALSIAASIGVWRVFPADILTTLVWTLLVGIVVLLSSLLAAIRLAEPWRRVFPVATLGDLARVTAALNFGRIDGDGRAWSEAEAWKTVRTLVSHHLGVPESKVTPQAQFVRDLRAS